MVKAGYAWWYEYYCGDNKTLDRYHNNAKKRKLRLWADVNPINPQVNQIEYEKEFDKIAKIILNKTELVTPRKAFS